MRFLLRAAFWLSIVVLWLPSVPSQRAASAPQVATGEALSAASFALTDVRQFCIRKPDACTIGSQALADFGRTAQAAAKMLYQYLTEHPASPAADKRTKPPQNSLSPADLAAPWRGAPARQEVGPKRPA
jgi:Family of unknown function (DUF5330)